MDYMEPLKDAMMEVLKYTIRLCEDNGLSYFAYGGTCLGAVRHKDIIPWDDDVDLLMPYEDYKKLLSLDAAFSGPDYGLFRIETPGYYFPFAKIYDKHTTLWERYDIPFVIGAFVDIFPLYTTDMEDKAEIDATRKQFLHRVEQFQHANQRYPLTRFVDNVRHAHLRGLLRNIRRSLTTSKCEAYRQDYEQFESRMHVPEGRLLVSYASDRYGVEIFQPEWFADYAEMSFRDIQIRVPIGWDAYLRHVFNDYMQLPPEDKRVSEHRKYYLNLREGLTLDEVRHRLRQGEKCVC